ncbi:uncharacterized protein si:ch211-130h14.4 [Engraulis encrasicolus]|uniref:uncharacterized protein si:ch211-130h14.4 n=1 Tax=Engraulis encrasicolus TaxID=184585 RepID=UPI002FD75180
MRACVCMMMMCACLQVSASVFPMASHSHTLHQSCTLPSILDSYLPHGQRRKADRPPEPRPIPQMRKEKQKQAATSSTSPVFPGLAPDADPDDLAQRKQHKALQDQHHLAAYWSLYRLRDEMADHYTALLREKVQRQRHDIRQRQTDFIQAQSKRINKKKRRHESQKLARSTLSHEDSYLTSLPKSTHYLILELQRHLGQRGGLQSRQEQGQLSQWLDHRPRGPRLRRRLQEMVMLSRSAPTLRFEGLLNQRPPLPQIQVSSHDKDPQGSGNPPSPVPNFQLPAHIRRPCKFLSLQPSFMASLKTPNLPTLPRPPQKVSINRHLLKLRHMHNLSLTHMAYSQRLLLRDGAHWEDGYQIRQLTDYLSHSVDILEPDGATRSILSSRSQQSSRVKTASDEVGDQEGTPSPLSPCSEPESLPEDNQSCDGRAFSLLPIQPLSMGDMNQSTYPVDIWQLKTWQNYA